MSTIKTLVTDMPVDDYVARLEGEKKQSEAKTLLDIFARATGMKPKMWGEGMVGYGIYHYKSERSRQEGDWPLTGFAMRKNAITIYIMPGFDKYRGLLTKLGKYKTSVSCLYVNKLGDIDHEILKHIIEGSVKEMRARYSDSRAT